MRRVNLFYVLLVVFLAAFALRIFRLDFQSLWYDEAFSVYLAQFNLAEIGARTAADIQPPLYYYLLHFWIMLVGQSEFAVRFLSLFFGALTIPPMYVTARRLFNPSAALIAAALATLSPLYLWYSQEARMYTLITFLLLLSSYLLVRALQTSPRSPNPLSPLLGKERGEGRVRGEVWLLFALANIAAVYTHYFAFVVIAFQLLYALVSSFMVSPFGFAQDKGFRAVNLKLENLKPVTISFATIVVAFLPWTPFVIARFGQDVSYWRGALKLDEAIRHIFINFTIGESVLEEQAQWVAAGWLVVFVIGLTAWFVNRKSAIGNQQSAIAFSILYLLIPLALLLILFSRNPKFNARYLMIASPPLFLLLGAGLASLFSLAQSKNILPRAIAFSFSLLTFSFLLFTSAYADSNTYFDPAFTKADFRGVARYIDDHIARDEAIILTSGHLFPAFNYYYRGDAPQIRLPDDPTLNADHVLGYDAANVLNQTLGGKRGTWVVLWQDEVVDPNGFVPSLLSSRGKEQKVDAAFWQVKLRHWTLPSNARFSPEPQPGVARPANFKNQVKLLGFDSPNPTPADVGASFNLYWQALDTFEDDYSVALRVRDAAGNLWGKQDRRPAGYNYPTLRWKKDEKLFGAYTVPLVAGTPAGDYFVEVNFYTASNQSGLDVLAPNGAPIGKIVKVGPIPVLPAMKAATFAALNIQNTISQPIGPFTLLGYQLGRDKASAGESIPLTLFWRADAAPAKDYTLRVQFGDVLSDALPLANPQFPTSKWGAGEIVRGQYSIAIPATAKDGATKLRVILNVGAIQESPIDLTQFTVEKTDRVFVKPNAQFAQNANFNSVIALVGYDTSPTVRPGETLKLVLYWQARGKMDKPYTVFVHLLDKDNTVVAQKDAQPANGARPTTGWVANEYIADTHELQIKAGTVPGKYQIEIGWYDAGDPSFARLQVLDDNGAPAGDHAILKTALAIGQ